MLVETLIQRAAKKFGDFDGDATTDAERYTRTTVEDWVANYNAALRQLVLMRPDANYQVDQWQLTANETRQAVPDACLRLISIDRNMGDDGSTPGAPIREVPREVLEDYNSAWHSADGETEVEFYAYEVETPGHFWVSPRVHASTAVYVEGAYGYAFASVAYDDDFSTAEVACDDQFINPVLFWMLKEAFEVDTDSAYALDMARKYEAAFYQALGLEFKAAAGIAGERTGG